MRFVGEVLVISDHSIVSAEQIVGSSGLDKTCWCPWFLVADAGCTAGTGVLAFACGLHAVDYFSLPRHAYF